MNGVVNCDLNDTWNNSYNTMCKICNDVQKKWWKQTYNKQF